MNNRILAVTLITAFLIALTCSAIGFATDTDKQIANEPCYEEIARRVCQERGMEFSEVAHFRGGFICSPDARELKREFIYHFLPEDIKRCGG